MTAPHPYSEAFRRSNRLGAVTGLAATVAVGLGMLAAPGGTTSVLAWVMYGLYLTVFSIDAFTPPTRWRWSSAMATGVMAVSGITLHLLEPAFEWTAVLFVVTAAAAAYELSTGSVAIVVVVQTLTVGIAAASNGADTFSVALLTTLYLAFQVFTVLLVRSANGEAEARRHLAAANAELLAATALLEASRRNTERLRIARDLHDVVGHQLTALALELEIAGHKAEGEVATHVERARTNAKDLLSDIREVVSELRESPASLEASVRPMLAGIPGLDVSLEIDEGRPVDETRALAVSRLVQEISTNTLRHASAGRLQVRVVSDDEGLHVEATDDGKGASHWEPGNGLLGMEERIAQLGGTVTFKTSPGHGFRVLAWIPIA
jgi:signal transduction histidine kinase